MSLPIDLRSFDRQSFWYTPNMATDTSELSSPDTPKHAEHLCVLVHGLWGNPNHLNYVANALREKYNEEKLVILAAKRNSGSFTYDGVEVGAERVAKEIEETLEVLGRDGYQIKKLSVVGYSLGGLVARYAIGLLYHKGYFDKIKPMTFTTFATPHLGVRTPLRGYPNHLWNVLGARTLSTSGRQLFTIDNFRDTGRPILDVLADPDSIFIHALAQFEQRILYCNIVNDRSAVYYTTGISRNDPYTSLDQMDLKYVPGYEPVILDPVQPCTPSPRESLPSFYERMAYKSQTFIRRAPIFLALAIIIPIASMAFLINSSIQNFRSRRRIFLHETDRAGASFGVYRIPYMVQDMRAGLEDAFENVNSAQQQDYLPDGSEEMAEPHSPLSPPLSPTKLKGSSHSKSASLLLSEKSESVESLHKVSTSSQFPTLALTPAQFSMIKALDDVGFRKYPVHITKSTHSHAAIIVRHPRAAFDEGKLVVKHWLEEEFLI